MMAARHTVWGPRVCRLACWLPMYHRPCTLWTAQDGGDRGLMGSSQQCMGAVGGTWGAPDGPKERAGRWGAGLVFHGLADAQSATTGHSCVQLLPHKITASRQNHGAAMHPVPFLASGFVAFLVFFVLFGFHCCSALVSGVRYFCQAPLYHHLPFSPLAIPPPPPRGLWGRGFEKGRLATVLCKWCAVPHPLYDLLVGPGSVGTNAVGIDRLNRPSLAISRQPLVPAGCSNKLYEQKSSVEVGGGSAWGKGINRGREGLGGTVQRRSFVECKWNLCPQCSRSQHSALVGSTSLPVLAGLTSLSTLQTSLSWE